MASSSVAVPACVTRSISRQNGREVFFCCTGPGYAAGPAELGDLQPVWAEGFGAPESSPAGGLAAATPVTWVRGTGAHSAALGGLHLQARAGVPSRPVVLGGRLLGVAWDGPEATECYLAGLHATDTSRPAPVQARQTYELMEDALAQVGMAFGHVVRTWLFLDDILAWYGPFNQVRTTFFRERGVFDGLVPASTGIGGGNPYGAAMVAGLYAVKPHSPAVQVAAVPSPLQCPALQYGSSFSRATEVRMADLHRLLVSGTASIDPEGNTQHVGDTARQIARTCEVVEAILTSRGMGWEDVTRATAYYRDGAEAPLFTAYWESTGRPALPLVHAENVICRHDLLFELEVDATRGL